MSIDYTFPNDVHVYASCRHWNNCTSKVGVSFVGPKGKSDGQFNITGANPWSFEDERLKAKTPAQIQEHADLIEALRSGNYVNETENVANSSLMAILGREAAYTGKDITWDEIKNSNLNLVPDKIEFGPAPQRPVPMPGQARL